ncbi:MAG: (2Fe-2S) ferredoxin domain-containing protein [Euryarchaeota archaeon]|nr:(2Fe-2S) ferredoxin domain-containing protein [Euryarchaeota archaeon]
MTKDFRLHAFVCTNQRDPKKPRECCATKNALDVMTRLKRAAKSAGIKDVRINKSGCLDKCEQGISCVVYPDRIWYTIPDDDKAIAKIVDHLAGGNVADEFLMLD